MDQSIIGDGRLLHFRNKTSKKRPTFRLLFCIFACVIGSSFQFGFHSGVVNEIQDVLQIFINKTDVNKGVNTPAPSQVTLIWSVIVAAFPAGGVVGGLLTNLVFNTFGCKNSILLNNILLFVSALLMVISRYIPSYYALIFGRLIVGVNCGLGTALAPIYLSEISPTQLRGGVSSVHQLAVVLAIFVSQLLGLPEILGTQDLWPILLGLTTIPAIIQLLTLPFCPESPKYLYLQKSDVEASRRTLVWLRKTNDVEEELREIEAECKMHNSSSIHIFDLFKNPAFHMPLLIAVVIQFSQQLSGINIVFSYSTSVFESAGFPSDVSKYSTLAISIVNILITLISLSLVEKLGRKPLHLTGLVGMFISACILTAFLVHFSASVVIQYFSILSVVVFVIFFAIGPGSIPWFITAELFTQSSRKSAMSIGVFFNWFSNFIVVISFPSIQKSLQAYSFIPFICLLFIFILFTFFKVPETKNKSIQEITTYFNHPSSDSSYETF